MNRLFINHTQMKYALLALGIGLVLWVGLYELGRLEIGHWLLKMQHWQIQWQRALTDAVSALREDSAPWQAWLGVLGAGFLYGLLHAIGPGHGKAVIGTFVLTQPQQYRLTLILSVGGALLQGVSAIVWVGVSFALLGWWIKDSVAQVLWLNRLAYAMVMVLGAWIVWRQGRVLFARAHGCGCGHHHCAHINVDNEGRDGQVARVLALLSIGLRPCSGAVLTLAVAWSWGMAWVGVATVMMMACGTACAIALMALMLTYAKQNVLQSLRLPKAVRYLALIGGVLLMGFAALMWQSDWAVVQVAQSRPF